MLFYYESTEGKKHGKGQKHNHENTKDRKHEKGMKHNKEWILSYENPIIGQDYQD